VRGSSTGPARWQVEVPPSRELSRSARWLLQDVGEIRAGVSELIALCRRILPLLWYAWWCAATTQFGNQPDGKGVVTAADVCPLSFHGDLKERW
jgi:hypothetical protein